MSFINKTLQFTTRLTPAQASEIIGTLEKKPGFFGAQTRISREQVSEFEISFTIRRMRDMRWGAYTSAVADGTMRRTASDAQTELTVRVRYGKWAVIRVGVVFFAAGSWLVGTMLGEWSRSDYEVYITVVGVLIFVSIAYMTWADRQALEALIVQELVRS